MWRSVQLVCATSLSALACFGQEAGYRSVSFANTTGQGSATLSARAYYPATVAGANAPMVAPPAGGYPVIVFLHGFTQLGSSYSRLGSYLSRRGYVVVLNNTGQFSATLQASDGKAYYSALVAANAQAGGFFAGALDMSRAGLSGHSAGGSNTVQALADNPGYRCGCVFAPVNPGAAVTAQVDVPLSVIQGEGDLITPWGLSGLPVYSAATGVTGLRTFYRLDFSGGHNNVAGLFVLTATDQEVWAASRRVMRGFFDFYLDVDGAGLDAAIGDRARAEPRLSELSLSLEAPTLWTAGEPAIGQVVNAHVASESLFVVLALAGALQPPIPTPLGALELVPSTLLASLTQPVTAARYSTTPIAVPADPTLVGADLALQGIGFGTGTATGLGLELSGAALLTVQL
ncbi:MAG: chlorophyllase/cutinase-like alpha/beta fold protein [Planctomycetota bacterium]